MTVFLIEKKMNSFTKFKIKFYERKIMLFLKSLNKEQKEAVGLLQIGTFLEYFDLMLYVHMAVVLNELFFPPANPHTAALVAALAFCSTYLLRPFGALLFGWLGDNIGRKSTVVITTSIMSLSCLIMANVPTYAQIGLLSTWIVTICRVIQGLSSMGEIMGAVVYTTEITKPPTQYPAVALIILSSSLGSFAALGIASLVTESGFNWRLAFWMGATIAVIGSFARTRLRETPEFLNHKNQKKQDLSKQSLTPQKRIKTSPKTLLAFFFIECSYPLIFYMTFIYFNPILKTLGYSPHDIISHNFMLAAFAVVLNIVIVWLVSFIHPLKILNFRANLSILTFILLPICLKLSSSLTTIIMCQVFLSIARGGGAPGDSIFIKSLYIGKRFTLTTFNYALSRALVHILSAFGLVYLTEWMGYYGIWVLGIPFSLAYWWGIEYFKNLEHRKNPELFNEYYKLTYKKAA